MTKILHLLILIFLFASSANAQCDFNNPGFENWSQQEFPLENEDGTVITGSALMPDDFSGLYKFAFGLFTLAFGDSSDYAFFENHTNDFFGIARSDDASQGNYSLKLYGNESLDFGDVIGFNECDEIPTSISLDVKHVGIGLDTFQVIAMWDEGLNIGLEEENLPNAAAIFNDGIAEETDFTTLTIPVDRLNNNPVDSMSIWIYVTFEDYTKSHFLIDNLKLNYTSSTQGKLSAKIEVGPNPTRGSLFITSDIQNGSQVKVYDLVGNLITKKDFSESTTIDLLGRNSGMYLVQISDSKGNLIETKKVLLNN